uniref:Uncharacterized protein n=1 Tax=viral metagenome TaxID=1070528 RepID=A0A6M3L788_9ZZZZ
MEAKELERLIACAELRNPQQYNASRERYIAEISFKAGEEVKDKEWDDWRVKYIPEALSVAHQEGREEYHRFMGTSCPHYVADRYYTESPCKDCYEAKLKEWGIEELE